MKDNVLYEDLTNEDNSLSSDMFDVLIEKDIAKDDNIFQDLMILILT